MNETLNRVCKILRQILEIHRINFYACLFKNTFVTTTNEKVFWMDSYGEGIANVYMTQEIQSQSFDRINTTISTKYYMKYTN